ncbi:MAG: LysR family transcriptional regulator [Verrucomicrobiae bacterium]|nr:LysR family transcriptional regulator [Verrucomicrobiae bacterium]MCB1091747.1 LysR family transcriptional regulator [Verrucomicrobiae bacterium]
MSLNVHHLELFYYVAKFEGITEAVRKMPYGIQQPAVSGQILQLEKSLGVKLFHRRPFSLTPAGEDLYDFVYPFFSRLDQVAGRLTGEESQHLRLAASATIMANHLPSVLDRMRQVCPEMRLTLKEVRNSEIESALQKQEADVAISLLHQRSAPGIKTVKLLDLPLVLLAPPGTDADRFASLSRHTIGGEIGLPLICLPSSELLGRQFQAGLGKRQLRWETTMEVNDLSLIRRYVAEGFGWGVSVEIPGAPNDDGVRQIALPGGDFAPLSIGLIHAGDLKPLAATFVDIARKYAEELKAGRGAGPAGTKAKKAVAGA